MKKFLWVISVIFFLSGCGGNEEVFAESSEVEDVSIPESNKETVPFLEELMSQKQESTEESIIELEMVGGGAGIGADIKGEARYLANMENYKEDEEIRLFGKTLQYQGERIPLKLHINEEQHDERIETMTTTVFLLNNGVPQPFYWESEEKETMHATFTATREEMYEGMDFELSFIPADAPYGSKSAMALFFVIQENYHFTNPNTVLVSGGGGLIFYVTAASEEYVVTSDAEMPVAGEAGTYQFDPNKDSNGGSIAITNQVTSGEQLYMNAALVSEEQLYATFVVPWMCEENTAFDVFAFMDGEPLYAINGSWYYRMYGDPNVLYEIPLDMSQIPSGDHLFCFVWFRPAYEHYLVETEDVDDHGVGVGAYVYDVIIP